MSACTNGNQTTIKIQTLLNARYWKLDAANFNLQRGVYFETAETLMENDRLFSSTGYSERLPVEFNHFSQTARVRQTFVFPETPSPNSQFILNASVTLLNLPAGYQPPMTDPPIVFSEPDIIPIPFDYHIPVRITPCP